MEEKKFYVYVYLDPRKPGKYEYGNYSFDYEPFYIGKGFSSRIFYHLKCKGKNYLKNKIISDLLKINKVPIIYKIVENLTNEESLTKEIEIISKIGRLMLDSGPLTNLTDGGEGSIGYKQSQETKNKRVKSLQKSTFYQTVRSKEFRNNASKFFTEYYSDEKNLKKISDLKKGDKNPMFGKTTSDKQKESVREAHRKGKIQLTENGLKKIIETSKKRKGTKNSIIRCDVKIYCLTSPNNENFTIYGSKNLQEFCKEKKLQFHVLKNNMNSVISEELVIGKRINAKNTIGWKIEMKN